MKTLSLKPHLSADVRQAFLRYFEKNDHRVVGSSRLVPDNDPTLLFTNAGMNQFKNVFLGLEKRDYQRAATSQKCVRAGGKHNDLENVGHTARHHTFFEMLGNFSFGDYFKKEAIHFAWEFITRDLGLPKDRLFVSVFKDDDEAAEIWHRQEGVPTDRIYRFGEKDNFWRMGETGPCGPCSEIFFDLGPEVGGDPRENVMGGSGDRYIEFWNLVFMQYNETADRQLQPLPRPSVDTGMGLERLCTILSGEINNYHTDLFQPLIAVTEERTGLEYTRNLRELSGDALKQRERINIAMRVLADHARAAAFLMADGILPSNEGRGYVLRRIMRRAIRYGRQLSLDQSLYPHVVEGVIKKMGDFYTELRQQESLILATVRDEEARFLHTLDQGTQILSSELKRLQNRGLKMVPGELVFKLYDTFGFPVDLTQLMADEEGFQIDQRDFDERMAVAREKAKASWRGKGLSSDQAHLVQWTQEVLQARGPSVFLGYESLQVDQAPIVALSDGKKAVTSLRAAETGIAVFAQTPFYGESGGQVGDTGWIFSSTGQADVMDCQKSGGLFLHHLLVTDGQIRLDDHCQLKVNAEERRRVAANHSATHLLHAALRQVLGKHVTQAGSLVEGQRLRFDFTHPRALTAEELQKVERLVNDEIAEAREVCPQEMPYQEALDSGALALFGEKYGDVVRTIRMGEFSMELCGGTHVTNTAAIRLFRIVSEGSVSSGVRRIEAITGDWAYRYLSRLAEEASQARTSVGYQENWLSYLTTESAEKISTWIDARKEEVKDLQKQVMHLQSSQIDIQGFIERGREFKLGAKSGRRIVIHTALTDRDVLREISDRARAQVGTGVVIVLGQGDEGQPIIVSVTKDLTEQLPAGKLLKDLCKVLDGKGGGRPDFAQGAVPLGSPVETALEKIWPG